MCCTLNSYYNIILHHLYIQWPYSRRVLLQAHFLKWNNLQIASMSQSGRYPVGKDFNEVIFKSLYVLVISFYSQCLCLSKFGNFQTLSDILQWFSRKLNSARFKGTVMHWKSTDKWWLTCFKSILKIENFQLFIILQ